MGEGAGLDFVCIEFVIAGFVLFFSFFGGREGSWTTPGGGGVPIGLFMIYNFFFLLCIFSVVL